MHTVRQCRDSAIHNRRTSFALLRGDRKGWYVCQEGRNLPHFTGLLQRIINKVCVAGYGHVLALHDLITHGDQAWLDLEVLSEETAETPDIDQNHAISKMSPPLAAVPERSPFSARP